MIKRTPLVSILIVYAATISCNRIKNEGKELINKTEEKVKSKSEELADNLIPHFDAYTPDTKFNKERFREFIEMEISSDIRNIYCFADAIGIDSDYMFAFNCSEVTAGQIIKHHEMTRSEEMLDYMFGLQHDFEWWDKSKIAKLDLYSWRGAHEFYKYFWYDSEELKAYYFEFDM